jgi:hypothetical protein
LEPTVHQGIDYTYHVVNGFKIIDGVVFEYECERCAHIKSMGHWSQPFVNKFFNGDIEELNRRHKEAVFPYGHLHEVKRIEHEQHRS